LSGEVSSIDGIYVWNDERERARQRSREREREVRDRQRQRGQGEDRDKDDSLGADVVLLDGVGILISAKNISLDIDELDGL
jgi:hypothetical protein